MSKIPREEWSAIAARHARGETIAKIAQSYRCTAPAIHYILKRQRGPGAPAAAIKVPVPHTDATRRGGHGGRTEAPAAPCRDVVAKGERHPSLPSPPDRTASKFPGRRPPAFCATLDAGLHDDAEAAIEAFRASFDAALGERSPSACARLRRAASDLMRMAARTTIVIDRLSAGGDQPSRPGPDYPRSARARADLG